MDRNKVGTAFSLPACHSALGVQDSTGTPGVKINTAYVAADYRMV